MLCQFLHLGAYGVAPRKGDPDWAAVSPITSEGARAPAASKHVPYPGTPFILFGSSPIEAGRLAIERAEQAFDHGNRRRRLRRDGKCMLAGVVSHPTPRQLVVCDLAQLEDYERWKAATLEWLIDQFGKHLESVVEHRDEDYCHMHFYVVPELSPAGHLNIGELHPGMAMKRAAAEAGADKRVQEAAYRSAMAMWQDDFWYAVGRHFGHNRYGVKRARLSRQERLMQKRLEADNTRKRTAERTKMERELAQRRAEWERERERMLDHIHDHERAHSRLRGARVALTAEIKAERSARRKAEQEIARLHAELAAMRGDHDAPHLG